MEKKCKDKGKKKPLHPADKPKGKAIDPASCSAHDLVPEPRK